MELFIMIIMFMIGTVFGSFFTLAVYRIPRKENIIYKHSYCPNCNHKLGFFDMIPILSFLMLKGKCRYCGKKIRIRYFCLELLSGIVFLLLYLALNINLYHIELSKVAYFISIILFISTIFLIAGIDKEKRSISKPVLVFGILIQIAYVIYLYFSEQKNINRYIILLILEIIFAIIENWVLKNKAKSAYPLEILEYCIYINFIINEPLDFVILIIATLISIAIYTIIYKLKKCNEETNILEEKNAEALMMPIGFLISISTIIIVIINTYLMNR